MSYVVERLTYIAHSFDPPHTAEEVVAKMFAESEPPDEPPTNDGPKNDPVPVEPNADAGDEAGGEPTPGGEDG